MSSKLAGLNVRNNLKANIKLDDKGDIKVENKKKISFKDSIFTKASVTAIFQLMHDEIVDVIPSKILFFNRNYQILRSLLVTRKMTIYTVAKIERENVGKGVTYTAEEWSSFAKLQMCIKEYYNIK